MSQINEDRGSTNGALAHNVRRLGHLDLPGAGQVTVAGHHAYVGHIPNKQNLGTSIVDIADPHNPRLVATVTLDDPASHSHKVRVVGDLMVVNHERNLSRSGGGPSNCRRAARSCAKHSAANRRAPNCRRSSMSPRPILSTIEAAEAQPYQNGGFRIYDIADPAKPKLMHHH